MSPIKTLMKMVDIEFASFNNSNIIDYSYSIGWQNHIIELINYFIHSWAIKYNIKTYELATDKQIIKNYALTICSEWVAQNIDKASLAYDETAEERKDYENNKENQK